MPSALVLSADRWFLGVVPTSYGRDPDRTKGGTCAAVLKGGSEMSDEHDHKVLWEAILKLESELAQLRGETVYTKVPVVAEGGVKRCRGCGALTSLLFCGAADCR